MKPEKSRRVFHDKEIRRPWHNDEWHFSISDIIAVLTDSKDELAYWRKLKQREPQLVKICHGLKMPAKDALLKSKAKNLNNIIVPKMDNWDSGGEYKRLKQTQLLLMISITG